LPPSPRASAVVYTRARLAVALVRAVGSLPGDRWLDPCVGNGALVHAMVSAGVREQDIVSVDLAATGGMRPTVHSDFVKWSLQTDTRFSKIVANPPFVSLRHLGEELRAVAVETISTHHKDLTFRANYWALFLARAMNLLKPGGSIAFILPAAWDYSNYAKSLRDILPRQFACFEVHRTQLPVFEGVQDGCVVVLGLGFQLPHGTSARSEHASFDDLIRALEDGRARSHWDTTSDPPASSSDIRVKDILDIRIGAVTGASKFFLLSEIERRAHGLPRAALVPVLSRSSHLKRATVTFKTWSQLRDQGERVWLFRPPTSVLDHRAVRRYLDSGTPFRVALKVRTRDPWYKTILPAKVDGFISGMASRGPWIALNQMPRLNATNTLYIVRFKAHYSQDEKSSWALSLLAATLAGTAARYIRRYPDGLLKLEPRDLGEIPLRRPTKIKGAQKAYAATVKAFLAGKTSDVIQTLHDWRLLDRSHAASGWSLSDHVQNGDQPNSASGSSTKSANAPRNWAPRAPSIAR
jgi:adenine-specific DNA-methyltransferase